MLMNQINKRIQNYEDIKILVLVIDKKGYQLVLLTLYYCL